MGSRKIHDEEREPLIKAPVQRNIKRKPLRAIPEGRTYSNSVSSAHPQPQSIPEPNGVANHQRKTDPGDAIFDRLKRTKFMQAVSKIHIPLRFLNIFLSVMTVICMVSMTVSIPMYNGSMAAAGSDAYIAFILAAFWFPFMFFGQLFFIKFFVDRNTALKPAADWSNIFFTGAFTALNGLLIAFASLPERTPPYLQAILATMVVPFTVIARLIMIRKGINIKQTMCILILFVGIFITVEPSLFGIQRANVGPTTGPPGAWYWPLFFMIAYIPMAIGNCFTEISMKSGIGQQGQSQTLVYIAWVQVFIYATGLLLFWADFIPGFGMAATPKDFINHLKQGIICFYGGGPTCAAAQGRAVLFVFSYCLANMFNILLIRYADGAVYAVVVMALVTPLGTIFWTFFSATPYFRWYPVFDETTIYVLAGLIIMMPAVVMYTYFSSGEEEPSAQIQAAPPVGVGRVTDIGSDRVDSRPVERKARANTVLEPPQKKRTIHRVQSAPELV